MFIAYELILPSASTQGIGSKLNIYKTATSAQGVEKAHELVTVYLRKNKHAQEQEIPCEETRLFYNPVSCETHVFGVSQYDDSDSDSDPVEVKDDSL